MAKSSLTKHLGWVHFSTGHEGQVFLLTRDPTHQAFNQLLAMPCLCPFARRWPTDTTNHKTTRKSLHVDWLLSFLFGGCWPFSSSSSSSEPLQCAQRWVAWDELQANSGLCFQLSIILSNSTYLLDTLSDSTNKILYTHLHTRVTQ